MSHGGGCTSLDHVYPRTGVPGMPCYCGRRTWGGVPRAALTLKVGERVTVSGEVRVVVAKVRGEDVYRVDTAVKGRTLFDREELVRA